jgi:hypothetical protein
VLLALLYFLDRWTSNSSEKEYQTPLPLYIKASIVILVIFTLVKMKHFLSGFMATFPMVGVVGAYETRFCFKTVLRQLPFVIFTLSSMITVCYAMQKPLGLYGGLAAGWVVYLAILFIWRNRWMTPVDHSKA